MTKPKCDKCELFYTQMKDDELVELVCIKCGHGIGLVKAAEKPKCQDCGGLGIKQGYAGGVVCCGMYLDDGQCCANMVWSNDPIFEYEYPCPFCQGTGVI